MPVLSGLKDKVAVVTGAGRMRSIGRSIAVELARAGCDIVVTGTGRPPERYPDEEKAAGWRDVDSVADEVRELGRRALPIVCDVADDADVDRLVDEVHAAFDHVDILVNNASAARGEDRRPVVDVDPDVWRRVIDVNLNGAYLVSRAFARRMIDAGRGGSIVNISSIAGKRLAPNNAAYAASKAGLQALTACMSAEVASYGIRVNAVCPGIVDTQRLDDVGRGEAWEAMLRSAVPLGRAGTGEDIANLVAFLCSDQASWITGQSWNIDGGTVVQH